MALTVGADGSSGGSGNTSLSGNSVLPPLNLKSFECKGSTISDKVYITVEGPDQTKIATVDNKEAIFSYPKGIRLLKREEVHPSGPDDPEAEVVFDISGDEYNKYVSDPYVDTITIGPTYYYQAYPYSDNGKYNIDSTNRRTVKRYKYICYGYRVVQNSTANNNGVISKMIQEIPEDESLYGLSNRGYTPVSYDTQGSWTGDEFIFGRSCALNPDTTVAYYIDEQSPSTTVDGKPITDNLNKMVEFGRDGTIIWERYVNNGDDTTDVYIANKQLSSDFHAWPFMRSNGHYAKHFYLPKYMGTIQNGKMLSILSKSVPTVNTTASTERTAAEANNISGDDSWGLVTKAMWDLYGDILTLLSMSTDSQASFGYGYCDSSHSSSIATGSSYPSQSMFNGLFKGSTDKNHAVIAMGVENPWGNLYRRIDGWNQGASGHTLIKLCKGTSDGSTSDNYNNSGNGYIDIDDTGQACSGYISEMKYDERGFRYPIVCSGSETTYFPDYKYTYTNTLAVVGGDWDSALDSGAFSVTLLSAASRSGSLYGSSPSCISIEELETENE